MPDDTIEYLYNEREGRDGEIATKINELVETVNKLSLLVMELYERNN